MKLDSELAELYKSCPQGLILILSLCNFRRTPKTLVVAVICHNTNYKQTAVLIQFRKCHSCILVAVLL